MEIILNISSIVFLITFFVGCVVMVLDLTRRITMHTMLDIMEWVTPALFISGGISVVLFFIVERMS